MDDPEVLPVSEIPPTLKRLMRYIARGFYSLDHALIVDILVHYGCVKEDDLADVLKYDKKQLRQLIVSLKNDKFLKSRMRVETDRDGKMTRHSYHFVNYSTFVNVIKYKLDHMRRKIEMEERDSTNRASFNCVQCLKTFTDLEADQLFDPSTGLFQCTFCQSEVEEESSSVQAADSRNLMAKFNEQIEPIYALLREVEDIKLSPELLEPEPTDIKSITSRTASTKSNVVAGSHGAWSGDATKNKDYFGYKESEVTVSMLAEDKPVVSAEKTIKERPVWMIESTIDGASSEPIHQASSEQKEEGNHKAGKDIDNSDVIMQTLLAHEKTAAAAPPKVPSISALLKDDSDQNSGTSESEDELVKESKAAERGSHVEEMESDGEMEEVDPTVMVGGVAINFHEISDDLVAKMTPTEKEAYIKLGQEIYDLYD